VSALPDLVELDQLPNAIREKDLDQIPDLSTIRDAIELRELWNTVDLVDFRTELQQLRSELEDVVGSDTLESSGDSEAAAAKVREFVDDVKPDATNAALQQQEAKKAAKAARNGVIDSHSKFEELYESTQRGSRLRRPKTDLEQPDCGLVGTVRPAPGERFHESLDRADERPTGTRRCLALYLRSPLEDGGSSAVRQPSRVRPPPRLQRRENPHPEEREKNEIGYRRATAQRQRYFRCNSGTDGGPADRHRERRELDGPAFPVVADERGVSSGEQFETNSRGTADEKEAYRERCIDEDDEARERGECDQRERSVGSRPHP